MAVSRICDVCRTGNETVRRYGLNHYRPRHEVPRRNGRLVQRRVNAGGIDMCQNCWDRIALPKTKEHSNFLRQIHPSLRGSRLQISAPVERTLATTHSDTVRRT